MLRLEPGDEPRAVRRLDLAKADEGGHFVPVAPHRALHILKPTDERVARDLEKSRRFAMSEQSRVEQVVARRLSVSANEIGQAKKARRHTDRFAFCRRQRRFCLGEEIGRVLRAAGHETDCVRREAGRCRVARSTAKSFEIDVTVEANDFHLVSL